MLYVPIFSFKPERVYYAKYQPWIDEDEDQHVKDTTLDLENVLPKFLSKCAEPGQERDLTSNELACVLLLLDKRLSRLDAFSLEWLNDPADWRHAQLKNF